MQATLTAPRPCGRAAIVSWRARPAAGGPLSGLPAGHGRQGARGAGRGAVRADAAAPEKAKKDGTKKKADEKAEGGKEDEAAAKFTLVDGTPYTEDGTPMSIYDIVYPPELEAAFLKLKKKDKKWRKNLSPENKAKFRDLIIRDDQKYLCRDELGLVEDSRNYVYPNGWRKFWDTIRPFSQDYTIMKYHDDFYRNYLGRPGKWFNKEQQQAHKKGRVKIEDVFLSPKFAEALDLTDGIPSKDLNKGKKMFQRLECMSNATPWSKDINTDTPWWHVPDDEAYLWLFDPKQGGPREPFWWALPEMSFSELMAELKKRNWTSECFDKDATPLKVDIWDNYGYKGHPWLGGLIQRPTATAWRVLLTYSDGKRKWVNGLKYKKGRSFAWDNVVQGPMDAPQQYRPVKESKGSEAPGELGSIAEIKDELFWATEPYLTEEQEQSYWTKGGVRNFRELPVSPTERLLDIGYHTNNISQAKEAVHRVYDDQMMRDLKQDSYTYIAFLFVSISLYLGIYKKRKEAPSDVLQALEFAQSKAKARKEGMTGVKFEDVAGIGGQKREMLEIVDFLKSPVDYEKLGVKPPKGVLLEGPPGTGKTLLAKAIAGEAGVPFYMMSGSEFMEIIVGVGAARVRDLFKRARLNAPCVVFLDEIDAIGGSRVLGAAKAAEEQEQTLNQLLTELDGFTPGTGVVFIAATNRASMLDAALLRAGRFDRKIRVERPGPEGRAEIFKVHAGKVKVSDEIVFEDVAYDTPGFSGADIAVIMNESALLAAVENEGIITKRILYRAIERHMIGSTKLKMNPWNPMRKSIALYELGYAFTCQLLKRHAGGVADVDLVSIQPRGSSWSRTQLGRRKDEQFYMSTRNEVLEKIQLYTAGRSAELACLDLLGVPDMEYRGGDKLTTLAIHNMDNATEEAGRFVTMYGMSKLGPTTTARKQLGRGGIKGGIMKVESMFAEGTPPETNPLDLKDWDGQWGPGESTLAAIDQEVLAIMTKAQEAGVNMMTQYKGALEEAMEIMLKNDEVTGDELRDIIERHEATWSKPGELLGDKTWCFRGNGFTLVELMDEVDSEYNYGRLPPPAEGVLPYGFSPSYTGPDADMWVNLGMLRERFSVQAIDAELDGAAGTGEGAGN